MLSGNKTLVKYNKFPFWLLGFMLLIRINDLYWVQSSFVPDEYWQSLEVAHKKVFGYGYLTWEWSEGIRSYFYVSLVSLLYLILKYLQLDSPELVILLPRLFQACLSALSDVYFIRWVYEKRSGQYSWALLCWLTTYFVSYCSTRTIINTFELNLTIIALYYYPSTPKSPSFPFIILVSLLCFIRPTAIIVWFPLIIINIFSTRNRVFKSFLQYLLISLIIITFNVALDSYFHGQLIFTPWNFFKLNLLNKLNSFYGSHDIIWYFYVGLPTVLGLQVIPFYYKTITKLWNFRHFLKSLSYDIESQMIFSIIWCVTILSTVPHKEFRFLLPILPMAVYVSSGTFGKWSTTAKTYLLYIVGLFLIISGFSAIVFLGRFHFVGPLDTMTILRKEIGNRTDNKLLFLAPCHTFPLYSHLHTHVSTRFLTCMPNLGNSANYIDEADQFYKDPRTWLKNELATLQPCSLPTHIIQFDSLNITNFLYVNNFTLSETIFNGFINPERIGKYIQIYKRKGKIC